MEETYGLQDYSDESATFSVEPVCGSNGDQGRSKECQGNFDEEPVVYLGLLH